MDASIFFRRRPIFWSWILAPLVLRIVIMTGLAALAQKPAEQLNREQAMANTVPLLQNQIEKNREQFSSLIPNPDLSTRERFLNDSAKLLHDSGVRGNPKISDKIKGQTKTYQFLISGQAPSLTALSQFLDNASRLGYLSIAQATISETTINGERAYGFSITFERTELSDGVSL